MNHSRIDFRVGFGGALKHGKGIFLRVDRLVTERDGAFERRIAAVIEVVALQVGIAQGVRGGVQLFAAAAASRTASLAALMAAAVSTAVGSNGFVPDGA